MLSSISVSHVVINYIATHASVSELSIDVAIHCERSEVIYYLGRENCWPFACRCDKSLPEPDDRALGDPLRRLIAFTCAHLHKRDPTTDVTSSNGTVGSKRKSDVGLNSAEAVEGDHSAQRPRIGTAVDERPAGTRDHERSGAGSEVRAGSKGAQKEAEGDESGEDSGEEMDISEVSSESSDEEPDMAEEAGDSDEGVEEDAMRMADA